MERAPRRVVAPSGRGDQPEDGPELADGEVRLGEGSALLEELGALLDELGVVLDELGAVLDGLDVELLGVVDDAGVLVRDGVVVVLAGGAEREGAGVVVRVGDVEVPAGATVPASGAAGEDGAVRDAPATLDDATAPVVADEAEPPVSAARSSAPELPVPAVAEVVIGADEPRRSGTGSAGPSAGPGTTGPAIAGEVARASGTELPEEVTTAIAAPPARTAAAATADHVRAPPGTARRARWPPDRGRGVVGTVVGSVSPSTGTAWARGPAAWRPVASGLAAALAGGNDRRGTVGGSGAPDVAAFAAWSFVFALLTSRTPRQAPALAAVTPS